MPVQEFKHNKVLISTPVYRLHVFNYGLSTPILIIPPHAGRHGNIVQNLCNKCVYHNRTVYAFELLSATPETSNTSISDLIQSIHTCQQFINEPVDLVCVCQGAWLGAIYTSLHPNSINRYVNFAGPINTQTGQDNIIENYCKTASISWHRQIITLNNGIQSGLMQWMSFALVNPTSVFIQRWFDLWNILYTNNQEKLSKWKTNNAWYDTPQDLAGTEI